MDAARRLATLNDASALTQLNFRVGHALHGSQVDTHSVTYAKSLDDAVQRVPADARLVVEQGRGYMARDDQHAKTSAPHHASRI